MGEENSERCWDTVSLCSMSQLDRDSTRCVKTMKTFAHFICIEIQFTQVGSPHLEPGLRGSIFAKNRVKGDRFRELFTSEMVHNLNGSDAIRERLRLRLLKATSFYL